MLYRRITFLLFYIYFALFSWRRKFFFLLCFLPVPLLPTSLVTFLVINQTQFHNISNFYATKYIYLDVRFYSIFLEFNGPFRSFLFLPFPPVSVVFRILLYWLFNCLFGITGNTEDYKKTWPYLAYAFLDFYLFIHSSFFMKRKRLFQTSPYPKVLYVTRNPRFSK